MDTRLDCHKCEFATSSRGCDAMNTTRLCDCEDGHNNRRSTSSSRPLQLLNTRWPRCCRSQRTRRHEHELRVLPRLTRHVTSGSPLGLPGNIDPRAGRTLLQRGPCAHQERTAGETHVRRPRERDGRGEQRDPLPPQSPQHADPARVMSKEIACGSNSSRHQSMRAPVRASRQECAKPAPEAGSVHSARTLP